MEREIVIVGCRECKFRCDHPAPYGPHDQCKYYNKPVYLGKETKPDYCKIEKMVLTLKD